MKRVMRQVFGSTRPRDIWIDLWTFDRLNAQALVHLVYWAGLCLLLIAAFGVAGVAIGNAIADGSVWGWMLALPMIVIGWLVITIIIVIWRVLSEFILSVMGIAEDLRVLRQYQEKLDQGKLTPITPAPVMPEAVAQSAPAAEPAAAEPAPSAMPAAATEAPPRPGPTKGGNIIDDPFFRPRFEDPEPRS
jgi:hypothetical protein